MLFKKPEQSTRNVIYVRSVSARNLAFAEKWGSILAGVFMLSILALVLFIFYVHTHPEFFIMDVESEESIKINQAATKRYNAEAERYRAEADRYRAIIEKMEANNSPSSPVQDSEDLSSGDTNSQVVGDHLGRFDRSDVGVREERSAGELQPGRAHLDGEDSQVAPTQSEVIGSDAGQGR